MHFSPEISPPQRPTGEHHFALRTLIRYLWTFHKITPNIIAQGTKGLSNDSVENYVNRPGKKENTINDRFNRIFVRLRDIINSFEGLLLPAQLLPLTNFLYNPDLMSTPQTPVSISETDLRSWQHSSEALKQEVLTRIVGMWRVVRISSAQWDNQDVPEFNISLLNIFNHMHRSELMPDCRLYSRGKFSKTDYNTNDGFILMRPNRFYIVGRMISADRLPFVLSFNYSSVENAGNGIIPHLTTTVGQSLSVNSHHLTISSYVFAEYIEGTANIDDKAEYEQRKEQERAVIGVYNINDASAIIVDKVQLSRLIQWSRNDMIWIMK